MRWPWERRKPVLFYHDGMADPEVLAQGWDGAIIPVDGPPRELLGVAWPGDVSKVAEVAVSEPRKFKLYGHDGSSRFVGEDDMAAIRETCRGGAPTKWVTPHGTCIELDGRWIRVQ